MGGRGDVSSCVQWTYILWIVLFVTEINRHCLWPIVSIHFVRIPDNRHDTSYTYFIKCDDNTICNMYNVWRSFIYLFFFHNWRYSKKKNKNNSQAKINVWTMKVFPNFNRLRCILDRKMVETMVLVDCWPIIRTVLPVVRSFFVFHIHLWWTAIADVGGNTFNGALCMTANVWSSLLSHLIFNRLNAFRILSLGYWAYSST